MFGWIVDSLAHGFGRQNEASTGAAVAVEPPPAKKQKMIPSDRITIDVGGTKFVTAASTLASNSSYFASLLSGDDWDGNGELFLDKDPVPFGILLAYMRRGAIRVEDIDTEVLFLAEFLKMEKLLLAVKVRWYINMGKGPVLNDNDKAKDEEIAALFDHVHGGLVSAIASGLFPFFLKRDDASVERDYANLYVKEPFSHGSEVTGDILGVTVQEVGKGNTGPTIKCGGLFGAINGLYAKGYAIHEEQFDHDEFDYELNTYAATFTFSRMRHSVMQGRSIANTFVPSKDEVTSQRESSCVKQVAVFLHHSLLGDEIIAPAEFGEHPNDPFDQVKVSVPKDMGNNLWLEKHGFVNREVWLEECEEFKDYMGKYRKEFEDLGKQTGVGGRIRIYSRNITGKQQD